MCICMCACDTQRAQVMLVRPDVHNLRTQVFLVPIYKIFISGQAN